MNEFQVGNWRLIPHQNAIESKGTKKVLRYKVMQVLLFLVQHHDRVVSREEMITALWDGNTGVGEKALTNAIWQIRSELQNDDTDDIILTIPKKGYQLKLPVSVISAEAAGTPGYRPAHYGLLAVAIIIVVSVFLFNVTQPPATDWQQTAPEQKTQLPGKEIQAVMTKQQDLIAFVNTYKGQSQLMVQTSDFRSPAKVISANTGSIHSPDWSPDGKHLLFIRQRKTSICEVVIVDIRNLEEIWHHSCHHPLASKVSYGPGGQSILLFDIEPESSQSRYHQIQLDTGAQSTLPISTSPRYLLEGDMRISPDGNTLAFTKSPGVNSESIAIYDLTTGKTTSITPAFPRIYGFNWTQNQEHIVFARAAEDDYDIARVSISDKTVASLNIAGANPIIVADNKAIIYELSQVQTQIIELNTGVSQLPPWKTLDAQLPGVISLNRYTQEFAFTEQQQANKLQFYNVATDSKHEIILPAWLRGASYPVVSPDNHRVAFLAKNHESDFLQVFVLTRENQEVTQLSRAQGDHFAPAWSADSSAVFTSSAITGNWEIWRYQLGGNTGQQVTHHGGGLIQQYGQKHFYSKADRPGLWVKDESGTGEELLVALQQEDWGNWGLLDNTLIYVQRDSQADIVVQRDLENDTQIALAKLPADTITRYHSLWINEAAGTVMLQIHTLDESALVMRKP